MCHPIPEPGQHTASSDVDCARRNSQLFRDFRNRAIVDACSPKSPPGGIREIAFDRFVQALSADRQAYSEKLDYFEVRFDGAVASLRQDAQDAAWREENRTTTIEYDPETNEPSAEVEKAAGASNPFERSDLDGDDYRSRLDAAIDTLPREQIRIIEMLRKGIPIDSKDPGAVTIAKTLGKSEKTIRIHRDRAFAALRAALSRESEE